MASSRSIEIPRKASLSDELVKFFFLSSTFLFLSLCVILYGLGGVGMLYSVAISLIVSLGWTSLLLYWLKDKLERVLGRVVYVIDLFEQSRYEKAVATVPIYEEMLIIIDSIKDILASVESKCSREISELQEELDVISENTSKIIEGLQLVAEGNLRAEFPSGLDLAGAIGQAVGQSLAEIRKRLLKVKEDLERLHSRTQSLAKNCESINDKSLKDEIYNILQEEEKILKELGFFKC